MPDDKPPCPECGDTHVTDMNVGGVTNAVIVKKCWNCGGIWTPSAT
jgi:uncharacterized Zn finger protein